MSGPDSPGSQEPPTCSPFKTNVTCLAEDDCKWIPTSPVDPGNMGLCMYDWDMCKAPPATPAPAKPAKKVHAVIPLPLSSVTIVEVCEQKFEEEEGGWLEPRGIEP